MRFKYLFVWLFVVAFAIVATDAGAVSFGQDTLSSKRDTLLSTVVTATVKPSVNLQSVPIQVVDKSDFEKLGIKELHEAVKTFSGVQIKDYGGIGGVKTVSIRSFGAQHTAISYDGVTISNAQSGQVDIGRFNLDNIQMVTLSIGPADDIFRTARMYASAGSVSITTQKPVFIDSPVNVGALMRISSFGTYNPGVNYEQKLTDKWSLALNADYLTSKGDYPFELTNGSVVTKETRYNSDVNTVRAEANVFGDMGRGGELSVKANYLYSERGLPGSVVLYNPDARERLWDKAAFVQARYKISPSEKWDFQAQLKYNYAWNKYQDEKEYYPGGVMTDYYTQQEYYGSVSAQYKPWKNFSFVVSQDFFVNTLDASYANFVYPTRYSSLTAIAGKYSSERLTVTASLLNTYVTEDLRYTQAAPDRHRLSPAVSLSYKLFDDKNIRIRASYQDVFRTPTFNDLYYNKIGNKTLDSEKAKQVNVGFTYTEAFEGVLDNISLQADGYYNSVKDKIVAIPTLFIWKMMNLGEVSIYGTDINLQGQFTFNPIKVRLQGNYSYQYAVDVTDKGSKNYKHQIPYTPRHSGNISATLSSRWINLGYVMSAVGERYSLPQNTKGNIIDGYTEHSLSVSRNFNIKSCKLSVQIECNNIGNIQYEVIKYYPMPGRSFRATLKFNY